MMEAEWLASSDPAAMLEFWRGCSQGVPGLPADARRMPSDRKLRLFACACVRTVWHLLTDERCRRCVEAAERYADDPSVTLGPFYDDAADRFEEMDASGEGELWQAVLARHVCNRRDGWPRVIQQTILPALLRKQRVQPATLAALLRDVCGNPWRPVVLPVRHREGCDADPDSPERAYSSCRCPRPYLTPQVLDLVEAAYRERVRKCGRCKGRGWLGSSDPDWPGPDPRLGPLPVECPDCRGTGTIDDGTLDPLRLAVLADALEEAGCPAEGTARTEPVTVYVQNISDGWYVMTGVPSGAVIRRRCGSRRQAIKHAEEEYRVKGWATKAHKNSRHEAPCWGQGLAVLAALPHPLLAHLRSPGPHVRGCWATDCILGKE